MSKALILGAAILAFSAVSALADGSEEPAPAPPQAYAVPPAYAAPVYTAPPVYVVPAPVYVAPAPVYVAPLVPRYYAAPVVSRPLYAYAPGYWGGYGHGWHGYGHRYGWR